MHPILLRLTVVVIATLAACRGGEPDASDGSRAGEAGFSSDSSQSGATASGGGAPDSRSAGAGSGPVAQGGVGGSLPAGGVSNASGAGGLPPVIDPPVTSGFSHPGIFSTGAELAFVKAKLLEGAQPWKAAFDELKSTNPTAHVVRARSLVPGSAEPSERRDMDAMIEDGEHTYAAALLWYFTGEREYADYAIQSLNAWSVFQKIGMPLYLTWAVPHFLNAAELLRHSPGAGWAAEDISKFEAMVVQYMWPLVQPPKVDYGSNHGATALESMLAIAVFLGDRDKLERALEYFEWLFPKYVFLDDSTHLDGECNETCRDLNHMNMGMLGLMYSAETAWHQSRDLWKPGAERWTKFAELHARIMLEGEVPHRLCAHKAGQAGVVFCAGNVSWSSPSGHPPCKQTAWDVLINHVGERLGQAIPGTRSMAEPSRPVGGITKRNAKWETLLKAQVPTSLDR